MRFEQGTDVYSYWLDRDNEDFPYWFKDDKGYKWGFCSQEEMMHYRARDKNPKDPYSAFDEY